jgi:spore germination protein KC
MPMCRLPMVFLVIIVAGSLFCLSGCSGVDIDERSLVVGVGVDKGKKARFRVSLEVIEPKGGETSGKSEFFILDQEANSIAYAVETLQAKSEKLLDFSHTKVIVMGEDIARKNADLLLDYVVRKPGLQFIAWMVVARPNANALLKVKIKSGKPVSIYINDMFSNMHQESTHLEAVPLSKFYARFYERGADPYLPILELKGDNIAAERLALFDKKRMRLELEPEEMSLFRLIAHKPKRFYYELNGKDENDLLVTMIRDAKVRYILKEDPKTPKIKYGVHLSGIVEESGNEEVVDTSVYEFEEEREIKNKVVRLLEKIQSAGLDPLGFGLHYLSYHWNPKGDWEAWQALYPKLKFEVDVQVQLRSEGLMK